jgi:release factor glutamine methyltransferase
MTTYGSALEAARAALRDAGSASPGLDARLLLAAVAKLDMAALIARAGDDLPACADAAFAAHLSRRLEGEPVARILGEREFWGLPIRVTKATLDPRPDTETLVEAVLEAVAPRRGEPLSILDLGTGTGCILAALLLECPAAKGVGIEIDPAAAEVARSNLRRLGLAARSEVLLGDWLDGVGSRFDVIVSNPPYIPEAEIKGLPSEVRGWDPHIALAGGADGLQAYRVILAGIGPALADAGVAAFEVGAGQAGAVAALAEQAGLADVALRRDLAGIERVVLVRCRA